MAQIDEHITNTQLLVAQSEKQLYSDVCQIIDETRTRERYGKGWGYATLRRVRVRTLLRKRRLSTQCVHNSVGLICEVL